MQSHNEPYGASRFGIRTLAIACYKMNNLVDLGPNDAAERLIPTLMPLPARGPAPILKLDPLIELCLHRHR